MCRTMWLVIPFSIAHAATPIAGLEWRPLSRADVDWVVDERTSGLGVGEFDGVVSPALTAFAGAWVSPRISLTGGLGIARLTSTTWVDEVYQQHHWGVIRPMVDVRIAMTRERRVGHPYPWLLAGTHVDIPSARDVSNAYTEEEQAAADEVAYVERVRLGGLGGRLGAGAELRVNEVITIGASWSLGGHWAVLRSSDARTTSSWISSEAALRVCFEWPGKS